ncbi:MAG: lysylphosphatidylglycerol synthase transmembrane domain-containing protein [Nitriliruptoraceae bacterium]
MPPMSSSSQPDVHGKAASSRKRAVALTALAIVGAYGVGLALVGIEGALEVLGGVSPWYLLAALGMQVLVVLLWSKVYRASAEATGSHVAIWPGLQVSMPAFTLSHTLPGGGWAGNALAAQRLTAFRLEGPVALAAVVLASTISLTAIAALGAMGIVMAFVAGDLPTIAVLIALPVFVVLVMVVAAVVAVLRSPAAGDRVVGAVGRLVPRLRRRVDDWRVSLRYVTEDPPSPGQLGTIIGWALLKWGADIASLALVFVAAGTMPRVAALLVGFGVTQLATAVPVTPGGAGFVEGGMIGAFVTLGYPATTAATVVIIYRVLGTWLPAIAGAPLLLRAPSSQRSDGG